MYNLPPAISTDAPSGTGFKAANRTCFLNTKLHTHFITPLQSMSMRSPLLSVSGAFLIFAEKEMSSLS